MVVVMGLAWLGLAFAEVSVGGGRRGFLSFFSFAGFVDGFGSRVYGCCPCGRSGGGGERDLPTTYRSLAAWLAVKLESQPNSVEQSVGCDRLDQRRKASYRGFLLLS